MELRAYDDRDRFDTAAAASSTVSPGAAPPDTQDRATFSKRWLISGAHRVKGWDQKSYLATGGGVWVCVGTQRDEPLSSEAGGHTPAPHTVS